MQFIIGLPRLIVFLFFIALIGRLVLDWVQLFARDWKPRGPILVVSVAVYEVTDPPIRALRRILPPLRLGSIQLDLAFMVVFLIVIVLLRVLPA